MPLVYQQDINRSCALGLWQIAEEEEHFGASVKPLRPIAHPRKRLQHLSALYLLQQLSPGFPFGDVRLSPTGRPFVDGDRAHFSISHSNRFAAAIFSDTFRVGIDVEEYSDRIFRVAHRFVSGPERQLMTSEWPEREQITAMWSVKEALYKWQGQAGLDFLAHIRIDQFEVEGETGQAACRIEGNEQAPAIVQIRYFEDCCMAWIAQ
jgi:phosphopantetheinyl transferase